MKPITVHNGDFTRIGEVLAALSPDTVWTVTIKERKDSKTLAQLRTIYGWFRYISTEYAEATGKYYQAETWKYHLKDRFGLTVEKETFGGVRTEMKSLADYNIAEMSKFMEDVNHFVGSEFSIFVPLPGEPEEL
jgi:hypothetical protein